MNYTKLVLDHKAVLKKAGFLKLAQDLASLLDGPDFTDCMNDDTPSYDKRRAVDLRDELFNPFCAIFAKVGLELPSLEISHFRLFPEEISERDKAETDRIVRHLRAQNHKCPQADKGVLEGLEVVFGTYSQLASEYGSVRKSDLIKLANRILLSNGLEVVRPDYSTWQPGPALGMEAPAKSARVLVFDDDKSEIGRTLLGLVGWPRLELVACLYERTERVGRSQEAKQKAMKDSALKIISLDPDVVLMDQGLIDFEGSELIPVIQEVARREVTFVANTGGEDDKLRKVGAWPNCNKGKNLDGLRGALRSLQVKKQIEAL